MTTVSESCLIPFIFRPPLLSGLSNMILFPISHTGLLFLVQSKHLFLRFLRHPLRFLLAINAQIFLIYVAMGFCGRLDDHSPKWEKVRSRHLSFEGN